MSESALLDLIDEVTKDTCHGPNCSVPISESVSDWFCSARCQQAWTAHENDVRDLIGYVEPDGGYGDDAYSSDGRLSTWDDLDEVRAPAGPRQRRATRRPRRLDLAWLDYFVPALDCPADVTRFIRETLPSPDVRGAAATAGLDYLGYWRPAPGHVLELPAEAGAVYFVGAAVTVAPGPAGMAGLRLVDADGPDSDESTIAMTFDRRPGATRLVVNCVLAAGPGVRRYRLEMLGEHVHDGGDVPLTAASAWTPYV